MFYIVPTPLGNRDDITLRALKVFKETNIIITENTGTTKKLLTMHDIDYHNKEFFKFTSYDHHTINTIISRLKNQDGILVSEAGTPALSDPGKTLIQALQDHDIAFTILPGANALIPAVVVSNFPTTQRSFYGFLPHKNGREKILTQMIQSDHASFFYESVHRVSKLMEQLKKLNFQGLVSVAREISKLHEQLVTGTFEEIYQAFEQQTIPSKGEFVIGLYPISGDEKKQK